MNWPPGVDGCEQSATFVQTTFKMQIMLLHGALGAASQFDALSKRLSGFATIHSFDFMGHGRSPMPSEPFLIKSFAQEVLQWMDGKKIKTMNFLGYSMGGYVALYLARHHPDRVEKIFTLATKFLWTSEIAEREKKNLDPEVITSKVPAFAQSLHSLHGDKWKELVKKSGDMIVAIAAMNPLIPADYQKITHPVLTSVGDSDKLVGIEETIDVYRQLSNAQLLVYPGTGHPLENFDADMVGYHAERFFGS